MCSIQLVSASGQGLGPDGRANYVLVEGTATGCELSDAYASYPGASPRAKVSVATTDLLGHSIVEGKFLIEEGDSVSFSVLLKGRFQCGATITLDAWCGESDSVCRVDDVDLVVQCGPVCPDVTFGVPHVGSCIGGERQVSVTAAWSGPPEVGYVVFRYGNQKEEAVGLAGSSAASAVLSYQADDIANDTITLSLWPGCERSVDVSELVPCCPGPIDLVVMSSVGEVVDTAGPLPPGSYVVKIVGDPPASGVEAAWTLSVGGGAPVTFPDTADNYSPFVVVDLEDESMELVVRIADPGCPSRDASVRLDPAPVPEIPCPDSLDLAVYGPDGSRLTDLAPCVPAGSYRVVVEGEGVEAATKTWSVSGPGGSSTVTASSVDLHDFVVEIAAPTGAQSGVDATITISVLVERTGCRAVRTPSISLVPCGDGAGDEPGTGTPVVNPPREPQGGSLSWCAFWLGAMIAAAVIGAVALAIGMCLLAIPEPTTVTKWVGIVLIVVGAVLMILAFVMFVLWLLLCASIRSNCWLLDILIDVLGVLAGASLLAALIVAIVASMFSVLCPIGLAIDTAYFGLLFSIAYWWARVVGCRPWPRWVPSYLRITLPAWMRFAERAGG